jgi:hypothetical protein
MIQINLFSKKNKDYYVINYIFVHYFVSNNTVLVTKEDRQPHVSKWRGIKRMCIEKQRVIIGYPVTKY